MAIAATMFGEGIEYMAGGFPAKVIKELKEDVAALIDMLSVDHRLVMVDERKGTAGFVEPFGGAYMGLVEVIYSHLRGFYLKRDERLIKNLRP